MREGSQHHFWGGSRATVLRNLGWRGQTAITLCYIGGGVKTVLKKRYVICDNRPLVETPSKSEQAKPEAWNNITTYNIFCNGNIDISNTNNYRNNNNNDNNNQGSNINNNSNSSTGKGLEKDQKWKIN